VAQLPAGAAVGEENSGAFRPGVGFMVSAMPLRRHFLPWDRPLLPQAAAHLAGGWAGGAPLDLSATLAIVPTKQSGRRLREALAGYAAQRGQAVFPPRVLTPEALLALGAADGGAATRLDVLLAWTAVLRAADPAEFSDVFPVAPPAPSFVWALRLAQDFVRLQTQLAEAGLRIADVPARAGGDAEFPEAARWTQLAELERRHDARLAGAGLRAPIVAELAWAAAPELPDGVSRVVLVAAPDPLPRIAGVLTAWARTVPVEIVVFAPETEAAAFDDWGRPVPDHWAQRALELPDFERRVRLCSDPAAQAEALAATAARHADPDGLVALGVADVEIAPLLAHALARAGVPSFDPEGRLWRDEALHALLSALAGLASGDSFAAAAALARCPDVLSALRAECGAAFSAANWLAGLDDLHARHLPADLAAARRHAPERTRHPELAPGLDFLAALRADLAGGAFPDNARAALGRIFRARRLDLARPDDARLAAAAAAWRAVIDDCARAAERFGKLDTAEGWELALRLFAEGRRAEDKPAGALELQGWLELLWEDAPRLLVAGLNDGLVPEAIVGDAFLPERLRVRLGLKSNAARFARDAYLLQALAAVRGAAGRLEVFFGKTSAAGDPLRPSRLLLRCPDADLPRRIAFLFRPAEAAGENPSWRRAWRLAPRRVPPPGRVAVTGLRAWLACPFRFYLSRVLRMQAVDPAKTELDVFDFGTLCHAALEAMGREPALRDETDAAELRAFLLARLDAEAARRFGAAPTLPLLVQLESARQRLSRAADAQAQSRAEGWVIEDVERPFELPVGELVVTGKFDRVDRHERTGALRVLDYKTSDRPVEPWQAHLRAARREETAPEFARLAFEGRDHVWTDLQLPLYMRVAAAQGAPVEGAYFNLPKAVGETGIRPWSGYTPELDAAAWRCAEGVAEAIGAGRFWPPDETLRPEQDDFAALFHHGVADSVAWEDPR